MLAGAAEIFSRQGYRATTMSEIAKVVGLSKPTLYHYFRNKEELLSRLYEDVMNESLSNAHRIESTVADPLGALRELIAYRVRYTCENQAIHKVFFEEEEELPPELLHSVLDMRTQFEDVMKSLVSRHLESTGRSLNVSKTVYVNTCLGAANWVYKWYDPAGPLEPAQLGQDVAELVLLPLLT
ncbi:TetR/AcrR family transcriptional regulator [Nocardia australiensis]|uniref:TetR/AcrR family transcriptional regulator n=1 Tax=Nocardia australiensis TaxID=2887191 RepID=UPI001D14DDA1|nr:TetR/AcrR family transcriptional regulator [Nocardia australiensis]